MKIKKCIEVLENEWQFESGFFGKLRQGIIDEKAYNSLLNILNSINTSSEEVLPKRFVALVWYIPTFIIWQEERCVENGYDKKLIEEIVNNFTNVIEDILGVP